MICFNRHGISVRTSIAKRTTMKAAPALPVIELTKSVLKKIENDAEKTAEAIKLTYVNDIQPGIARKKTGKTFQYYLNDKRVTDEKTLARIKKLVIPPAWEKVWICKSESGHLQATGFDLRGRKQYRYHSLWNKLRNETKYFRLLEFGKTLPAIREQLDKDIAQPGMPQEKILAALIKIMESTTIRVGNSFYEKLYGSFGLTTLKNKHATVKGDKIRFDFKGKKGVQHSLSMKSRKLANIVRQCLDIPGKELFQYYDENQNVHGVDSGLLNDYIRQISGKEFSSKDFRTWQGTLHALLFYKEALNAESEMDTKHTTVEVLDKVAEHLGNTRTVCKKYYVHPCIIDLYESDKLDDYLQQLDKKEESDKEDKLSAEEKLLIKILETATQKIQIVQ